MLSSFRSLIFLISIFVAFFASGAASLIAEVTWNRMLIVVVGNSVTATAMIIAVFMGGLGLGSYLGGRVFGTRRASLVPYLLLELAVGVYVLLSPSLFDLLAALFTSLSESVDDRVGLTVVRIVVSLAALLVPATLMGATFPAMISGAAPDSPVKRSARTGYLYSVNTLGAAIGCFAAGYHLLLEFGVRFSLNIAFGLYLFAAVCALVARAASVGEPGTEPGTPAPARPRPEFHPRRRFLNTATFAVGFVALAYEVLLTRLSILYLGNSVSVFPLVLTGFLLGTALSAVAGTWLYGVLRRLTRHADGLFGVTALAAGAFVLATPYILLTDWVIGPEHFARFADATPRNPLPILGIIVAPTVLIGALLPVAIRMLQGERRGDATRGAATLYALNTGGGLLGAAVANHYLVPWIGIQGTTIGLTAICAAVGVVALVSPGRNVPRWSAALAAVGILTVGLVVTLPGMMDLYAEKIAESTRARSVDVRLIREGRAATVAVLDQDDPHRGSYRDMYLNGVEEASTRYWHTQLFKLLGILPVLVHESDEPRTAMVIAFGAGITAGSVLASSDVSSLDVVDLNPDIEEINDLFTEVNGDVYHQPRFHFQNDDGRNYLVTCSQRYDLIIGDSTHPRAYDSWILYTVEFYEAVKKRLLPGGVFAQWVPVHGSMQGELFRIHLNTFRSVFPNTTFWYVYGSDQAFLMATPEPLSLDVERLQGQLDGLPEWFQADHYQLDTVTRIAGFFWMDGPAMARMIGGETRLNRDDRHFFDKQSTVRPLPPQARLPMFQTSALPYLQPVDEALREAVRREQLVAGRLARYGFFLDPEDLYRAYCAMPGNGNARYWMELATGQEAPDPDHFCVNDAVLTYRAELAAHPGSALAMNALADALGEAGRLDEAHRLAIRALDLEPENGMILDTYGWVLFKRGKSEEALAVLEHALARLPGHPIVLYHLGAVHDALGNREVGRRYLEEALSARSDFPGAEVARDLLGRD